MNSDTRLEDLVLREEPRAGDSSPAHESPDKAEALAAYMTHELRAPLTSVRAALAILTQFDVKLDPEQRQLMAIAVKNCDRLDRLIDDIMDFSKIRSGKMRMEPALVAPESLVLEAMEVVRAWALAKGVRLRRLEAQEPLPLVRADSRRAVQALVNLLSNAIKFTPQGGKVEISADSSRHEYAGCVVFKVKDTGPGVPPGDLERIFACFEQAAVSGKTSGGTGLGLTLAKAMVELQGGRIWAESWKGLGATFAFTLPSDASARPPSHPAKIEFHGLLFGLFKRLNSVVAALFA